MQSQAALRNYAIFLRIMQYTPDHFLIEILYDIGNDFCII